MIFERQYLSLLAELLNSGERRLDRTGVGTLSLFGKTLTADLSQGFPLLTTKRLHTRSIVAELLWMLAGETNVSGLHKHGVTIWDEWADERGDLGPVYGAQWRRWRIPSEAGGGYIDQIEALLQGLREEPESRRHLLCAWNVSELHDMVLPPCHVLAQFYVREAHRYEPVNGLQADRPEQFLDCQVYQRSADVFLGLPFNVASYALLTSILAQVLGMRPGRLRHVIGDAHLYANHVGQAREQIAREPRPLPSLRLAPKADLFAFEVEDVAFDGYRPHARIAAEVAA